MGAKISDVRLEPAGNGVILSWCERKEKANSKNTYDNCTYEYPKEVFEADEGAENAMDEAFDKAQPRFKELWKQQYAKS